MSKLTGTLEGKSISNRGHSNYSLDMSGTLDVDGKPIQVKLFGQYELQRGNPKGQFVITTGSSENDREEGVSWVDVIFESISHQTYRYSTFDQSGVFQSMESGRFKLEIESRKYGKMDDHWIITFGPNS